MKLTLHRLSLPLAHPFTISRGTVTDQSSLVVQLEGLGESGWGEVTANDYYGHTLDSIESSLAKVEPYLDRWAAWGADRVWGAAAEVIGEDPFALSALDMAWHDWSSRRQGMPLYRCWGLDWETVPCSSFTIGIDTPEKMVAKLRERPDWPIYKIKLGTSRDLEIMRELRRHTDATFRVDANCGWTAEQAIANSAELAELGVEFIEQPLPADAPDDDHRRVFHGSRLPIIADENCQTSADVTRCHGRFHGVNVKLCKCGGLTPALRMLRQARELGMRTMVGCMIESSIGISGAAHLLPLLDYADLDGAVLLRDDPAIGVTIDRGSVRLAAAPGTGGRLR